MQLCLEIDFFDMLSKHIKIIVFVSSKHLMSLRKNDDFKNNVCISCLHNLTDLKILHISERKFLQAVVTLNIQNLILFFVFCMLEAKRNHISNY